MKVYVVILGYDCEDVEVYATAELARAALEPMLRERFDKGHGSVTWDWYLPYYADQYTVECEVIDAMSAVGSAVPAEPDPAE